MLLKRVFKCVQNGFYIDFFWKKISEVFLRNLFIYAAQFFGEKYVMGLIFKYYIFRTITYNINKYVYHNFSFRFFVVLVFIFIIFIVIIVNLFALLCLIFNISEFLVMLFQI
jgi:signal transduction histidine kinase